MSVLIAIIGLALLIVLHEGGHFLAARLCGMRVERFSVGFGKPLVSWKKGDTTYQIAPIPFGGFVQITGLNPHEEFDRDDPYVYPNRPRWMRFCVLAAGPAANYLTAVVLAIAVFVGWGKPTVSNVIVDVLPNSAAAEAGLKVGDVLRSGNGRAVTREVPLGRIVGETQGQPLKLDFTRNGAPESIVVTPRKDDKTGAYLIGVKLGQSLTPVPIGEAVREAVILPAVFSADILKGLYEMIVGKQQANLSGPVGIAREMAKAADRGLLDFIQLLILLSIYLGLFNLLPLPALDGGRILFLGVSALRQRDVNARTEATVHTVGIMVLLGVLLLVTFKDVKEIILRIAS